MHVYVRQDNFTTNPCLFLNHFFAFVLVGHPEFMSFVPYKGFKVVLLESTVHTVEPRYKKPLVQQTIFFTPIVVKYMEKNLDITKPC